MTADASAARLADNPFLGLRPFGEDHAALFFGRKEQVRRLVERLEDARFVAVVGTSGCGKSSLVLAGLVPELKRGGIERAGRHWRIASMRPGAAPIVALGEALLTMLPANEDESPEERLAAIRHTLGRGELGLVDIVYQARLDDDENLLLIVDQFEELYNYAYAGSGERAASADDAAAFVKLLLAGTERPDVPIYVALTMRSDFIGDCARFRDLPEAVNAGLFLVPRLSRDEMRAAIESPVKLRGTTMTPRLVSRLLNDIGSDSDQLPVLQHALMRTWAAWAEAAAPADPIDVPHYVAIGEMAHALEQHAEDLFRSLDERQRLLAEKLFRCLTTRDSENRGKRRPTAYRVAQRITDAAPDELDALIQRYNGPEVSFIRPSGPPPYAGDVIDISHESLMRLWKRLSDWVDAEAEAGRLYARLVDDATVHRPLWINPDLALAESWLAANEHVMNAAWAARYDPALTKR